MFLNQPTVKIVQQYVLLLVVIIPGEELIVQILYHTFVRLIWCVQKDGPALAAFAHSVASVCCQITPSQYSRRSGMVFPIRGSQFHQHALSVWPARNTCTVLLALSAFGAVQVKL